MAISEYDVRALSRLARIALTDSEVARFQQELDSIVTYISIIQSVPIPEGVASTPHLALENVMRDDVPADPADPAALLDQAPHRQGAFVKVKKILG